MMMNDYLRYMKMKEISSRIAYGPIVLLYKSFQILR